MENNNVKSLDMKVIVTTVGACLSFIIGAGTVSGQEIMQFLTSFGYWGIGGCVIALILYSWYTMVLLDIGHKLQIKSSEQAYKYFLGDILGMIYEYFTIFLVFIIFVVMLSGAGSTLTQYLGINEVLGRAIATVVVLGTVLLGLKRLVEILGFLGPIIIIFAILIGGVSFFSNIDGFLQAGEIMKTIEVAHPSGVNIWWISAVLYVTFTIVVAVPFYTTLGSTIKYRKNALVSGIATGVLFMAVATIFYLGMLSNIADVFDKAIPTLELAQSISPLFGFMFTILIILAIYSTAVPLCWTVCNKFAGDSIIKYRIIAVVTCLIGFFGALLPFGQIIGIVYPSLGYLGAILSIGMFYRYYINKGDISKYAKVKD